MPTEAELEELARIAERKHVPVTRFHEPDRNDELTAIALGPKGRALVAHLPLTLKVQ